MANDLQQSGAVFAAPVIAKLLNITERRLQQLVKEGIVPKAGRNQYPLAGCIRGYVKYLQAGHVAGEVEVDPERLTPFMRRAHYQSELEKLKLETERRELIPRIEVEQEMAHVLKIVAEMMDTLPDILERDCGLKPKVLDKVEKCLDKTRDDLHTRLTEGEIDVGGTVSQSA